MHVQEIWSSTLTTRLICFVSYVFRFCSPKQPMVQRWISHRFCCCDSAGINTFCSVTICVRIPENQKTWIQHIANTKWSMTYVVMGTRHHGDGRENTTYSVTDTCRISFCSRRKHKLCCRNCQDMRLQICGFTWQKLNCSCHIFIMPWLLKIFDFLIKQKQKKDYKKKSKKVV